MNTYMHTHSNTYSNETKIHFNTRPCYSQAPLGRGVLLDCFLDIGMSFGGLLELYIELFDLWSAKKPAVIFNITVHTYIHTVYTYYYW